MAEHVSHTHTHTRTRTHTFYFLRSSIRDYTHVCHVVFVNVILLTRTFCNLYMYIYIYIYIFIYIQIYRYSCFVFFVTKRGRVPPCTCLGERRNTLVNTRHQISLLCYRSSLLCVLFAEEEKKRFSGSSQRRGRSIAGPYRLIKSRKKDYDSCAVELRPIDNRL